MRLLGEFGVSFWPEPPRAGAGGIAGLRHEAVDDAVEHHAVIEALARELLDARDMVRREVGPQLDGDRPVLVSMIRVFSGVAAISDLLLLGRSTLVAAASMLSSASAATCILTILSGLDGGSPCLILSTASMPSITWPQTVYWPSRNRRRREHDEELAVGAVRVVGARHADGAALEAGACW